MKRFITVTIYMNCGSLLSTLQDKINETQHIIDRLSSIKSKILIIPLKLQCTCSLLLNLEHSDKLLF